MVQPKQTTMKNYKFLLHNGEAIVEEIKDDSAIQVQFWRVTNPLDDLLKLQREKEAAFAAQAKYPIPQNATFDDKCSLQTFQDVFVEGYMSSHHFTAEDMVGFAKYVIKREWDFDCILKNEKSASKLVETYLTETALSRLKESDVEIEMELAIPKSMDWMDASKQPKLTDGKVTITKFI